MNQNRNVIENIHIYPNVFSEKTVAFLELNLECVCFYLPTKHKQVNNVVTHLVWSKLNDIKISHCLKCFLVRKIISMLQSKKLF